MTRRWAAALVALLPGSLAGAPAEPVTLPATPEVFVEAFRASEGITFNAEGQLFIGANRAIWGVQTDGAVRKLADVDFHLGQAGIGERDILAADFGPKVALSDGPNDDGVVWRVTPEGEKSVAARGIGDPNFVLVLADRSFLVSDDFTNRIYRVSGGGEVEIWSEAIGFPNGMALSADGSTLYVAQIFSSLDPVVLDNRVWALPIADGRPAGPPRVLARAGEGGVDGLALDALGRVYVADNPGGRIWRIEPSNGETVLVAEGMPHVASLVFGEGEFDRRAIYATSTFKGGGKVWKVHVGVEGAELYR